MEVFAETEDYFHIWIENIQKIHIYLLEKTCIEGDMKCIFWSEPEFFFCQANH